MHITNTHIYLCVSLMHNTHTHTSMHSTPTLNLPGLGAGRQGPGGEHGELEGAEAGVAAPLQAPPLVAQRPLYLRIIYIYTYNIQYIYIY